MIKSKDISVQNDLILNYRLAEEVYNLLISVHQNFFEIPSNF